MDPFLGLVSSDQIRDSLAALTADVGGFVMRSVQTLKFKDGVKRDPIFANSSVSIGVPAGQHMGDGSFQVIPSEFMGLIQNVGDQWTQIPTTLQCTLNQQNGGGVVGVGSDMIMLNDSDWDFGKAGGSDPSLVTVSFVIVKPVDYDGLSAIRDNSVTAFSFPSILGL